MPTNDELADQMLESVEQEMLRHFILSRTKLDTVDPKSAEAQAEEIRQSMQPKDFEEPNPYSLARDKAREIILEWIDIADKAWGPQSEEP